MIPNNRSEKNRICKRLVQFGNPSSQQQLHAAGGTYNGAVYTCTQQEPKLHQKNQPPPLIEGALSVERIVAMVGVPPEQVPEGVLNLVRSHRPWIEHIRIVIEEPHAFVAASVSASATVETTSVEQQQQQPVTQGATLLLDEYLINPSLIDAAEVSAVESAASILAAEQQYQSESTAIATTTRTTTTLQQQQSSSSSVLKRTYLVLIQVSTETAADEMIQYLNGQPYTFLDETQTASIHHVVALRGEDGGSITSLFFRPPALTIEQQQQQVVSGLDAVIPREEQMDSKQLTKTTTAITPPPSPAAEEYNCAVCLERMHTSILTTVCNHSFHMDCLLQWQDSPCPVCRYDHGGLNTSLSQCHVCGTTENNYVCLICGVVSCGGRTTTTLGLSSATTITTAIDNNYINATTSSDCAAATAATEPTPPSAQHMLPSSHARQHYDLTLHAYALDTITQHVWDFCGQGYVHRLLQNKDDGKLVEVNDPNHETAFERSQNPGLSDAQQDEVVHRKLEGFASQYYTLLKSQLEQQRVFYKSQLDDIRHEYKDAVQPRKMTSDLIAALKSERRQLSNRLENLQLKCAQARDEVDFLKSMNEGMELNNEQYKKDLAKAHKEQAESRQVYDECIAPLQQKVTDLILELEQGEVSTEVEKPGAVE